MSTLLITGRNGQVGNLFANFFIEKGWACLEVAHTPCYSSYIIPKLGSQERIVLIHSGQPNAPRSRLQRKRYLESSEKLFMDASLESLEVYFISSLSAHKGNLSHYSKDKRSLETKILALNGNILRLGLLESYERESVYSKLIRVYSLLSKIKLGWLIPVNSYFISQQKDIKSICELILQSPQSAKIFQVQSSLLCDSLLKEGIKPSPELSDTLVLFVKLPLILLSRVGSGVADLALNLISGMAIVSERLDRN